MDKETSTMRLIHLTLQEYLSPHLHIPTRPCSPIAEICLNFLNSQFVNPQEYDGHILIKLLLNLLKYLYFMGCSILSPFKWSALWIVLWNC